MRQSRGQRSLSLRKQDTSYYATLIFIPRPPQGVSIVTAEVIRGRQRPDVHLGECLDEFCAVDIFEREKKKTGVDDASGDIAVELSSWVFDGQH